MQCITGRICGTGQPAWNETELRLVREYAEDRLRKEGGGGKHAMSGLGNYEQTAKMTNKLYSKNCRSKLCSEDLIRMVAVCGPLPNRSFADGQSCVDGSTPMTEDEFQEMREESERELVRPTFLMEEPTEEKIEKWNREANASYAKNCMSKKCYYHYQRGSYRCKALPLQPTLFLPFTLLNFLSLIS